MYMGRQEKILNDFLRREGTPLERLPPVPKIFVRNPNIYQNYVKKPSLNNLTSEEEADMDRRSIYSGRESDIDGNVFYNARSSAGRGKKHKSKRKRIRRTREHNAKTKKGKANRLTRKKSTRKKRKH